MPSDSSSIPRLKAAGNTRQIGLRINATLSDRLTKASEVTGLSQSDLLRVGIVKVAEEVERTGSLRIQF